MPENPLVDIFIPVCENHSTHLRLSVACALRQTYTPARIVIYADGFHPNLEFAFKDFWYRTGETPNFEIQDSGQIHIEKCQRGLLVRRFGSRSNTPVTAKKWYYEWSGKADYVKFFDADDIILPRTIEIMMKYMKPDIDGVICPLIRYCGGMHDGFYNSIPSKGTTGSGSMLLRKEFFNKLLQDGYTWDLSDHDLGFHHFVKNKNYKFVQTRENFLYIYIKD